MHNIFMIFSQTPYNAYYFHAEILYSATVPRFGCATALIILLFIILLKHTIKGIIIITAAWV